MNCLREAAKGGHPQAKDFLSILDIIYKFGTLDDANIQEQYIFLCGDFGLKKTLKAGTEPAGYLPPEFMIWACDFIYYCCTKYNIINDFIENELDAASHSPFNFVHDFIQRTGIKKSIYLGGMKRCTAGSPVDKLSIVLHKAVFFLKNHGYQEEWCIMARCTIVGYLISKSKYSNGAESLLGVDDFFENAEF